MQGKEPYFLLTSKRNNPTPWVKNWYGRLKVEKLNREEYKKLPPYVLLEMELGTDIFYPDIMIDPVLMVSREAMEVIMMYEDKMPFIYIALYNEKKEEKADYYCPILAEGVECGEALFRIRTIKGTEIWISRSLAEALLSRGAEGMELTEKLVEEKEDKRGMNTWEKSIW